MIIRNLTRRYPVLDTGTVDPESSSGHRVAGSSGHRVAGSSGHRVAGSSGHRTLQKKYDNT